MTQCCFPWHSLREPARPVSRKSRATSHSCEPSLAESASAGRATGHRQGVEEPQSTPVVLSKAEENASAEIGIRMLGDAAAFALIAVIILALVGTLLLPDSFRLGGSNENGNISQDRVATPVVELNHTKDKLVSPAMELTDPKDNVTLGAEFGNRRSKQLWQERLPWQRGRQNDDLVPDWVQGLAEEEAPGTQRGFVVVTPHFGIGNRLLGAVSAAALALALNYSLSVIWEDPHFHEVLAVQGVEAYSVLPAFNERGAEELDLQGMSRNLLKGANVLACSRSSWTRESASVLHITTDQFFLPLLQLGEHGHRQALQDALGSLDSQHQVQDPSLEIETWSHALLSGLFHLGPTARQMVEAEAARLLSGASFILGVHVRTRMYDFETDTVPDLPLPEVLQCVQEAFLAEAPADSQAAVIFLASPSEEVKMAFRSRFGDKLRTREGIEVDRLKPAGDLEAVIDLALLAASDALVTSVHSTFGYVAQALARVRPYVIAAEKPHCARAVTTAPCFHLGKRLAEQLQCEPPPELQGPHGVWASCWF